MTMLLIFIHKLRLALLHFKHSPGASDKMARDTDPSENQLTNLPIILLISIWILLYILARFSIFD